MNQEKNISHVDKRKKAIPATNTEITEELRLTNTINVKPPLLSMKRK
jgi:hypothetical protein